LAGFYQSSPPACWICKDCQRIRQTGFEQRLTKGYSTLLLLFTYSPTSGRGSETKPSEFGISTSAIDAASSIASGSLPVMPARPST